MSATLTIIFTPRTSEPWGKENEVIAWYIESAAADENDSSIPPQHAVVLATS